MSQMPDWIRARAEAEAALERTPDDRDALLSLARSLVGLGEIERARLVLSEGKHFHPSDATFLYQIGRLFLDMGEREIALSNFALAAEQPNATADLICEWAALLRAQGEIRPALAAYQQALAREPQHENAREGEAFLIKTINDTERRLTRRVIHLDANMRFPAPYIGFTGRPHGKHPGGGRLDEWGFPNLAPPSPTKPRAETRVFVLGDSTMWNSDNGFSTSVPTLLQQELHRRGRMDVKTYNFAVPSSCATQMLALLFFKLVDYEPDLIVIFCGGNDLFLPIAYDPRQGYPYNFYVIEELYTRFFDFDRVDKEGFVYGNSDLLQNIALRQAALIAQRGPDWEFETIDVFIRFLNKLDRVAIAYGLNVAVLMQPIVCTKATLTDGEASICPAELFEYYQRQYERYQALLFSEAKKPRRWGECVTIHDATDVFDGETDQIFTDFIHYNQRGSDLLALRMADVVMEQLALAAQSKREDGRQH